MRAMVRSSGIALSAGLAALAPGPVWAQEGGDGSSSPPPGERSDGSGGLGALSRQETVVLVVGAGALAGGAYYYYQRQQAEDDDSGGSGSSYDESGRQHGLAEINAVAAYDAGASAAGKGQRIGIADSGLAIDHVELKDQLAAKHASGTGYGLDLKADVNGGAGVTSDPASNDHGSHVGGIAAAEKNDKGIHGVAYKADLVPYALIPGSEVSDFQTAVQKMVKHAVNNDVAVINNSWGTDATVTGSSSAPSDADEWQKAINNDIAVVFATGNNGADQPTPHAGLPDYSSYSSYKDHWIAVTAGDALAAADDPSNAYAQHCGVAQNWCIAAPGGTSDNLIQSTVKTSDGADAIGGLKGTSMAAPHVAGAIAVLKKHFDQASITKIIDHMFATADDSAPYDDSSVYGHGMLDLENAVSTPMGTLGLATPNGGWTRLDQSALQAPAAVGDGLARSLRGTALGTVDSYGGDFLVPGEAIATAPPEPRLSHVALARARRGPQPGKLTAPTTSTRGPVAGLVTRGGAVPLARRQRPQGSSVALAYRGESGQGRPATGALVRWRHRSGAWQLGARTGVLTAEDSWLGGGGTGAFALDGTRAGSLHGDVRLARQLGPHSRVQLRVSALRSELIGQPKGSLVRGIGPAWSSAWRLGWHRRDLAVAGDRLRLGFRQPLRVETGTLALAWPEPEGEHSRRRLGLEPSGRTVVASAAYRRPLTSTLDLGTSAGVVTQPGHRRTAKPEVYWGVQFEAQF